MNPKHALYAPQAHPFVESTKDLLTSGFALRDWLSLWMKTATTGLA